MSNRHEIHKAWKNHTNNYNKFKDTAMELLVHPDATQEQLNEVVTKLREAHKRHIEAANKMRESGYGQIVDGRPMLQLFGIK